MKQISFLFISRVAYLSLFFDYKFDFRVCENKLLSEWRRGFSVRFIEHFFNWLYVWELLETTCDSSFIINPHRTVLKSQILLQILRRKFFLSFECKILRADRLIVSLAIAPIITTCTKYQDHKVSYIIVTYEFHCTMIFPREWINKFQKFNKFHTRVFDWTNIRTCINTFSTTCANRDRHFARYFPSSNTINK